LRAAEFADDVFTPAALRDEDFGFVGGEVFADQPVPVAEFHAVILADAEALFLMGADDVTDEVTEESPVQEFALPRLHGFDVGAAVQAQGESAAEGFFRKDKDAARGEDAFDFQENGFDIHELTEHLEGEDGTKGVVLEGEIEGVAGDADGGAEELPGVHQGDAVAERVGGNVEGETVSAELVGKHVAGVAGVGADFEEGSEFADIVPMLADDCAAADVFFEVDAASAVGFAQGGEVVELDLGAFDSDGLGFFRVGQSSRIQGCGWTGERAARECGGRLL